MDIEVKKEESLPLVSVVVITYNSQSFIIETLESIKAQTYPNIELIISDDCSTDDTAKLCHSWLESNARHFVHTDIVVASTNRGIPVNCNQGLDKANGEWVKFIAGDDILINDSIINFINYTNSNPLANIIESKSQFFKNELHEKNMLHVYDLSKEKFYELNTDSTKQYKMLLRRNYLHAPSVIIKKDVIIEAGGFDVKHRWIEDHPLWLKLTQKGNKIFFMDEVTVFYRIHDSSVYSTIPNGKSFNDFYRKKRNFEIEYIFPYITTFEKICMNYEYHRKLFFDKFGLNNYRFHSKVLNRLSLLMHPKHLLKFYFVVLKKNKTT